MTFQKLIDRRSLVDLVILDLVRHSIQFLIKNYYTNLKVDINDTILKWMRNFLINRIKRILLEVTSSSESSVTYGILQGTMIVVLFHFNYR